MGRLTKEQIDQIATLRNQGYCQKEIAEKLKVHLRTVRKYDPTSRSRVSKYRVEQGSIEKMWQVLVHTLDWLDVMAFLLLDKDDHCCPRCTSESLGFDVDEVQFICRKCGFKLVFPHELCRSCFVKGNVRYDKNLRRYTCDACKAVRE